MGGVTPYSKAIGVHARTLEIYEQLGLAERRVLEVTVRPGEKEPLHMHRWSSVMYVMAEIIFAITMPRVSCCMTRAQTKLLSTSVHGRNGAASSPLG